MRVLFLVLIGTLCACGNDQNFKGAQNKKEAPLPSPQPISEPTQPESYNAQNLLPEAPQNAVTKGSFTAYTIPETPRPQEDYVIVIEVKLPSNVSTYDRSDLSGQVIGTDAYTQTIGTPNSTDFISNIFGKNKKTGSESFSFSAPIGTLRVMVPGAKNLVKDTIQIRSNLLNESQTLTLQFKSNGFSGNQYESYSYSDSQFNNWNSSVY